MLLKYIFSYPFCQHPILLNLVHLFYTSYENTGEKGGKINRQLAHRPY